MVQPESIAGAMLSRRHEQREVPRHDTADNADRYAAGAAEARVAVFVDSLFQRQRRLRVHHRRAAADFELGLLVRLALLRREEAEQLVEVGVDRGGHLLDDGAAIIDRGLRPGLERAARGGDGAIKLFGAAAAPGRSPAR
jgi:hypothetical protein